MVTLDLSKANENKVKISVTGIGDFAGAAAAKSVKLKSFISWQAE